FRIVPNLLPGSYSRSGISVPWTCLLGEEALIEGDWLQGCAMMWKTAPARETGFNEHLAGHSTGEDLDFSLRMANRGALLVARHARVLHLPDRGGRPNAYMMAYTGIRNAYDIHRNCLHERTWKDVAWFLYAFGLDSLVRSAALLRPGDRGQRWCFVMGRLRFFREFFSFRQPRGEAPS